MNYQTHEILFAETEKTVNNILKNLADSPISRKHHITAIVYFYKGFCRGKGWEENAGKCLEWLEL